MLGTYRSLRFGAGIDDQWPTGTETFTAGKKIRRIANASSAGRMTGFTVLLQRQLLPCRLNKMEQSIYSPGRSATSRRCSQPLRAEVNQNISVPPLYSSRPARIKGIITGGKVIQTIGQVILQKQ